MNCKKVVLAYSGGLDTSVILKWLKEERQYEVVAVCIDVGQKDDYEKMKEKAYASGADQVYIVDAKEDFIKEYVFKGIKANATYETDYLLGTAFARPLMAKKLVEIAEKEGAFGIVHGATGKGNDQVRFEAGIYALNPKLKVIAPWREWDFKSRENLIDYAQKHNIPIPVSKEESYSRDENLWHISHEGMDLEETWNMHSSKIYKMTTPPEQAPNQAEYVDITFEQGEPTEIDGKPMNPMELLSKVNEIGGRNGIGVSDIVESRLVGMKSRGVYETPGGSMLYLSHKALEKLVLDRQTLYFKELVGKRYGELLYDGWWFSSLREALDAFVENTQKNVTGVIRLKCYKGNCTVVSSKSKYTLYDVELVTFEEDHVYDQKDAEGFIKLFSLPLKIQAMKNMKKGE